MKLALSLITSAALALLFGACNQHSWEGEDGKTPVKELFKKHGHDGHDDHSEDEHEKDADKQEGEG